MRRQPPSIHVERTPQHLPVPLGDVSAVHRRRRPLAARRWWTGNGPTAVSVGGVLAAMCGGVLATTASVPEVGLQREGLRLGDTILPARSAGWGGGAIPAMVIGRSSRGAVIAAGNGSDDGVRVSGRCELRQREMLVTENCVFQVGARGYRAEDTLDLRGDGSWHRRYDDGQHLVIRIPRGAAVTPVPFPIGKR
ncbi:MAG: hypothetical protein NVSMB29_00650 [Candidatus Dormibacteria bacterium]